MKYKQLLFTLFLFLGACGEKFKHKPVMRERTNIVFVEQFTPAMRVITDTFRYEFNADSSIATKSWHRDTFYLVGRVVYDSTKKKDTTLTYVIPKDFILKEKMK